MSESAKSAKSAKQIFANFVKFVKPIFGTTRRTEGRVTEAEYPTNYQRISNLSLTIRPFRVAILAVLLLFVGGWNSEVWGQLYGKAVGDVVPDDAGQVRVSYNNSTFTDWSTTYTENSGKGGSWINSSHDFTMAFQAEQTNSAYEFFGWFDNSAGTGTAVSTNLSFTEGITAKTRNGNNKSGSPATITRYAVFKAKPVFYFKATATTNNSTYGNAYVTFTESSKTTATTPEATTNCYGTHYNTASMTKTAYFRAVPKTGYVFKGWSTTSSEGDIFNTDKSITYNLKSTKTNSASPEKIQYYAIFGEKFAPQITGTDSVNKEVGDSYTADFSFVNTSSTTPSSSNTADFYYTIKHELSTSVNNGTDVISYTPSTGAIQALNAGKATITFINKPTTTHQYKEESFVINVAKKEPTFSCGTSMNVGENLSCTYSNTSANTPTANSSDNFYYVITNNTPTGITSGSDTPGAILTFSGNKVYGKNAGTSTITFYQKETYMYEPKNSGAINITVSKLPNTLYANNSTTYKPTMRMGKDLAVTLTATNTDYTGSPIQLVEQTAGDNTVAVFDYTQNTHSGTVHSKFKKDVTATWSIHQDENYKYEAANGTFSVDVKLAAENTCYVLENQSNQEDGWHGNTYHEHTWEAENVAGVVKFDIYRTWGADMGYNVQQLLNGSWQNITDYKDDFDGDWQTKTQALDPAAKGVRFRLKGGSLVHVKNVSVTRKTYLNASDLTIDKTASNNPVYPSDGVGVGTLPISYSLANGGNLKISNDNPKFTISPSEINVSDCNGGSANISISYASTVAGTDYAHLVIYNDVYRKEVTITGITSKRNQTVEWNVGNAIRLGTETENAAAFNVGNPVSYSSSKPAIIEIKDNKLVAKAEGSAVITATSPGNGEYNDGVAEKTIEVTNDLIQTIVWNQSFLKLKLGGANITLNASAHSDVAGCTTNGARPITYSSNNESVVRIVNTNQLQIMGTGSAVITATQAGGLDGEGHKYMRVTEDRTVIVRDPNAPCDNYVYIQPSEHEAYLGWNHLNRQSDEFVIDNLDEPSTLTLRYKGEYKTVWGVDYFYGTMRVEEWYDDDWHLVPDGDLGTPQIGKYQTLNTTLQRRTTKVRIRSIEGCGYHYFTDCKIGQSRYIEATELSDYEAKVGQSVPQTTTISYNNIVGDVSITLGHTPSNFSVSQETISGDCGDKGSVVLTVTYQPTSEVVEEQELLTISDETSTCQITLRGSASLTSRYISWDETPVAKYTVETVTLDAQALTTVGQTSAGKVFYSLGELSSTGVLSGTNNSTLTFENAGVAYVIAQGKDDPQYNIPVAVTKQFNVSKTPTSISVAPTVETIVSGTAAEDVVLNTASAVSGYDVNGFSGTVPGTWSVIEEDLNTVGENRSIKIHFEPSNTDMFIGCDGYINNVTVSQREATEEEVIGVASAITYGQTAAEASTLSNDGTLAGTWEWIDERADDVLAVYTYTDMQARFTPENGNIQPKVVNVSLTVNKANPVATVNAVEITYGATAASVDLEGTGLAGEWTWTDSRKDDVLAVGEYTMDVHFKPTDLTNYNEKDATVALKVKKITTLEVDVPLSFCAGGSVNFHGNTYSEAGEYQVEAEGSTRDTIYNVTVTKLQPTTGTDSKTITVGASESWNGINLSGYAVGPHEMEFRTTNAAGCDSTVTLALTVVPATNIFTNAKGDGEWSEPTNWSNGVPTGDEPDVIISGALIIDDSVTVGGLTILPTGSIAVITNGTLTVNGTTNTQTGGYGDIHVKDDGTLALGNSADLQVRHFTLDAKLAGKNTLDVKEDAASGQVENPQQLAVNGDAYFQMTFDPKGKISYGWYDFVVPFPVNISDGIFREGDLVNHLVSGVDFLVQEYSETKNANKQKAWSNFYGTMQPGRVYTITFNYNPSFDQNVFVFKKAAGGAIGGPTEFATQYTEGSGTIDDCGWNGLGNGMLQHGYITGTFARMQVYNHAENKYDLLTGKNPTFAIGTSFFVQVDNSTPTMTWYTADANEDHPLYAPKRVAEEVDEFLLSMREENHIDACDHLYFSGSEEATEDYVIGHDLRKMGNPTEAKVAQMWATKNGKKLCDIETRMVNYEASSDLNFFAPNAGQYILAVEEMPEDATLYLTYNGNVIWDLTASPYVLDLTKGTTTGYALRIVAANAPQITTGVDDVQGGEAQVRKVIIDNKMYIITPEGAIFDAIGKKVQ